MISERVVPTEAWRCDGVGALLVTLFDLFRIQDPLNQHGYHTIL
jgi:hypothetical protein